MTTAQRKAATRKAGVKARAGELPLAVRRHSFVTELARGLQRCDVAVIQSAAQPIQIVIGVSGGADSLALLLGCVVLARRRKQPAIVPSVVHVHHHLRESADADADFVKHLSAQLDVPCRVLHVYPSRSKGNVLANARRLRYNALADAAHELGASFVAVAHHAEDQLETMIAALARGAGLDGLAGMPWSRRLDDWSTLIRPLLAVRRSDCEDFCRAARVQWRDDPSNLDANKTRVRIRRDVLPVLEELFPDAPSRATSTAELVRSAKAALDEQLQRSFGPISQTHWNRRDLQVLSAAVIAAGLRRAALHVRPDIADVLNQRHLMQAAKLICSCDRKPHRYDWPGGLRLSVSAREVSLKESRRRIKAP